VIDDRSYGGPRSRWFALSRALDRELDRPMTRMTLSFADAICATSISRLFRGSAERNARDIVIILSRDLSVTRMQPRFSDFALPRKVGKEQSGSNVHCAIMSTRLLTYLTVL